MEENKTQKINFFKKVWYAVTKFEKYPDMASEGIKSTIKYLFIATAIVTVFIVIGSLMQMHEMVVKLADYIGTNIPEFSYTENGINMDITEPMIIEVDDKEYNGIDRVYINPNIESDEEKTKAQEENSVVGVTIFFFKDQIKLINKNEDNQTVVEPYTYKDFIMSYTGEEVNSFSKQELVEYMKSDRMNNYYRKYVMALFIYLVVMNFIYALLDSLKLAVLGWITSITARVRMNLLAIYNMSIYALTLPMILNIIYVVINYFTNFTITYFPVAYLTIAYIYLAASIFIIKDDFMKKQEEVEKIKQEQIKVREEIKQKEEEKRQEKENKGEGKTKKKKEEKGDKGEEPDGSEA